MARDIHYALVRRPGADYHLGITTRSEVDPDPARIYRQHLAYCRALEALGVTLIYLDALPGHPDAYFVEDTAVLVPGLAVITRPGAPERRGETTSIAAVLGEHMELAAIEAPGTIDGGDVLRVGKQVFIGISGRTNTAGAQQLADLLEQRDFQCRLLPVAGGLHLKSALNDLGPGRLLLRSGVPVPDMLREFAITETGPGEALAANVLWINDTLLMPGGYPATRERLQALGITIRELDVSAVEAMDGGLTCMSLRW